MVGGEAVRLLGHPPVEAAQTGLDVRNRHVQLRRGERRGERRVGVAVGEHHVRPVLEDRRLERLQHAGGLPSMRSGADAEVEVRLRNSELGEEDVRHRRVVMLPGMHDQARRSSRHLRSRLDRAADRCELHELRARTHDLHQPNGPAPAGLSLR